jgi:cytochrome c553
MQFSDHLGRAVRLSGIRRAVARQGYTATSAGQAPDGMAGLRGKRSAWRGSPQFGLDSEDGLHDANFRSHALVCPTPTGIIAGCYFSNGGKSMRPYLMTLLLMLAPAAFAADGDPAAGKTKSYTCTGCHGIPGYNNVYPTYNVPKIGGQHYEYLVAALTAYRDGQRQHPTMQLQAGSLSDQDVKDVAAYFASFGKNQ